MLRISVVQLGILLMLAFPGSPAVSQSAPDPVVECVVAQSEANEKVLAEVRRGEWAQAVRFAIPHCRAPIYEMMKQIAGLGLGIDLLVMFDYSHSLPDTLASRWGQSAKPVIDLAWCREMFMAMYENTDNFARAVFY